MITVDSTTDLTAAKADLQKQLAVVDQEEQRRHNAAVESARLQAAAADAKTQETKKAAWEAAPVSADRQSRI